MGILQTDLYQLTMAAGYFHRRMTDAIATCEMFVRRLPKRRRFLLAMGLERFYDYLEGLRFEEREIDYLATVPALRDAMTPEFRDYLRTFRFTGDVDAIPEGTALFANEPFVRVRAPIVEAQIVETFLLSAVNHATMVASKAARVVRAAGPAQVIEFGSRRTHPDAAVDAARAAYCAGFSATSNVEAGLRYGIPITGTAAHMWTMAHPSEEAAFEGYSAVFPNASILLIDTYDTVRGAERAARIAKDKLKGVRIDSGDLDASSRAVRKVLDDAGCAATKIVASGDLNEVKIAELRAAGAPIDSYGVGTDLVCSIDAPALGGVYKLVELERGGEKRPIAKFSEGKGTLPGGHQLRRSREGGKLVRDTIALHDEAEIAGEPLLQPVVRAGRRVGPAASLEQIRAHVRAELAALPDACHELDEASHAPFEAEISPAVRALVERVRREHGSSAQGGQP